MAGDLCFLEYVACIFLCGIYLLWVVELRLEMKALLLNHGIC